MNAPLNTGSPAGKISPDADITQPGPDDDAVRARCRRERASDLRPNILLVFTDQQTAGAMGCAGNRFVHTPHMDALAARGLRFESSYCAAPICGPARGSLVTGQPPHRTGVVYNGDPLPSGFPTIGSVLREAGYYTAWTGKWHLPESFVRERRDSHGFHHRPLSHDVRFVALGDQTDFLTATDAEFFLRREAAKQPKPWFLGVSLHNPHDICYHVPEPGMECTNTDTFPPLPTNFEADPDEPAALKLRRENSRYGHELGAAQEWTPERWREYLHTYAHLVSQADRALGYVLRALDAGGWRDNTLVIFTSDHGEGVAAHKWATKLSLYEESTAVPLIMALPRVIPPSVLKSPASALGLMPTICDFAGSVTPPDLPGASLRRAVESGQDDGSRRVVVCELAADPARRQIQGRMVRAGSFKYCVYAPGLPSEQFFDLANDPGETLNLAGNPSYADDILRLRAMLAEWCAMTSDPFRTQVP